MNDSSMFSHGVGMSLTLLCSCPLAPVPSTLWFLEAKGGIYFPPWPQFSVEFFTVAWPALESTCHGLGVEVQLGSLFILLEPPFPN